MSYWNHSTANPAETLRDRANRYRRIAADAQKDADRLAADAKLQRADADEALARAQEFERAADLLEIVDGKAQSAAIEKACRDAALHGIGFVKDGERIDPRDFYAPVKAEAQK